MELRIEPYNLPEQPQFNYEELEELVQQKMATYEAAVYTDDQMRQAKVDIAALRKLRTALNNERIKQERAYMEPFKQFKEKIDNLIKIIDRPIAAIDKQVKAADERRKAEKQKAIEEFFAGCKFPVAIRLDQIFDPKWLNASCSMETIKEDIMLRMERARNDIAAIRELPEYAFEAEQCYMTTLDLSKALNEAHRLRDMAARKAEAERLKAERIAAVEAAEARMKEQQAQIEQQAATVAKSETVEPEPAADPFEGVRHWLTFKARMTIEDAKALRSFFVDRGIEFEVM